MNPEALAEAVFKSVKTYCDEQLALQLDQRLQLALAPVLERMASLKDGAPGEKGEPGENGAPGVDGKDGIDGMQGPAGKDGADAISIPGSPGDPGRDGRDGKQGPSGRDAAQLEVLESIDPTRGYNAGVLAKHRGGLIRATRYTDSIELDAAAGNLPEALKSAGWQILLDPVVDLVARQSEADPRQIHIEARHAYTAPQQKTFRMPVMVYRGTYAEGDQYQPGDCITWAGSTWHCEAETTEKPGDTSKHWRLAVKRGRDGKEGKDGADGRHGKDAGQHPFGANTVSHR